MFVDGVTGPTVDTHQHASEKRLVLRIDIDGKNLIELTNSQIEKYTQAWIKAGND
jgi:hypothetical protein